MDVLAESTKFEYQLCTNMKQCRYSGSGRFEFCLDYVEFRNDHKFKIALKNMKVPKLRKNLKFQVYIGKFYENFNKERMMKSFDISFESYHELSETMEILFNQKFNLNANICLNFETAHSDHVCDSSDQLRNAKKISITYKNDRFFLHLASNVVAYISTNLAVSMAFHTELAERTSQEIQGDYVKLFKPCYVSSKKTFFLSEPQSRLNVVLYDGLSQQVVLSNGEYWSILYSGKVQGDTVGPEDEILCVKKMSTKSTNEFCIGFYDGNMEPFRCNEAEIMSTNPFSFTLVFLHR